MTGTSKIPTMPPPSFSTDSGPLARRFSFANGGYIIPPAKSPNPTPATVLRARIQATEQLVDEAPGISYYATLHLVDYLIENDFVSTKFYEEFGGEK